jgi:hypothetical protein
MFLGVIATPRFFTGCGLILVAPGLVWVMLALAHMYGQIARQAEEKSAASV